MLIIVGNLCAFVVAHIYLFINFIYDFCDNLKLATRRRSALSATDRGALFSHSHSRRQSAPPTRPLNLIVSLLLHLLIYV